MESLRRLFQWFSLLCTCVKEAISFREKIEYLTSKVQKLENQNEEKEQIIQDRDKEIQRLVNAGAALASTLEKTYEILYLDHVTCASNKAFLVQNIANIFSASERAKKPLGILAIDVDHFKSINDTYGHPVGDKVLAKIVSIFRDTVRTTDHVVRNGGDEFIIILNFVDNITALEIVAEKLLKRVSSMTIEECSMTITLSIGGLFVGLNVENRMNKIPQSALERVDELLYVSKREGRNRATILSS